jgi:hypothetical protein
MTIWGTEKRGRGHIILEETFLVAPHLEKGSNVGVGRKLGVLEDARQESFQPRAVPLHGIALALALPDPRITTVTTKKPATPTRARHNHSNNTAGATGSRQNIAHNSPVRSVFGENLIRTTPQVLAKTLLTIPSLTLCCTLERACRW